MHFFIALTCLPALISAAVINTKPFQLKVSNATQGPSQVLNGLEIVAGGQFLWLQTAPYGGACDSMGDDWFPGCQRSPAPIKTAFIQTQQGGFQLFSSNKNQPVFLSNDSDVQFVSEAYPKSDLGVGASDKIFQLYNPMLGRGIGLVSSSAISRDSNYLACSIEISGSVYYWVRANAVNAVSGPQCLEIELNWVPYDGPQPAEYV